MRALPVLCCTCSQKKPPLKERKAMRGEKQAYKNRSCQICCKFSGVGLVPHVPLTCAPPMTFNTMSSRLVDGPDSFKAHLASSKSLTPGRKFCQEKDLGRNCASIFRQIALIFTEISVLITTKISPILRCQTQAKQKREGKNR